MVVHANGLITYANGVITQANGLNHTSPGQRPGNALGSQQKNIPSAESAFHNECVDHARDDGFV